MTKRTKPVTEKKEKIPRSPRKAIINQMPSGVRGLDEILGGGIPEFSFNVIAGMPGRKNYAGAPDRLC